MDIIPPYSTGTHCHPYFKQRPSLHKFYSAMPYLHFIFVPIARMVNRDDINHTATSRKNRLTQLSKTDESNCTIYMQNFHADSAVSQKHTHNNHVFPMLACHVTFKVWRMTAFHSFFVGKCTQRQLVVPKG